MPSHNSSPAAYLCAVMHAMKHPTQPVCGLLIGRRADSAASGDTASSGSGSSAFVVAAVPLIHTELAAAGHPVTEVALKQVAAVCRSNGRRIVGLYFANERLDDMTLHEH